MTALTHQEFLPAPAVDTGITSYGVPYENPTQNPADIPTTRPTERLEHNDSSPTNNHAQESQLQSTFASLEDVLQVRLLSPHATMPSRATSGSAGYDLYSAGDHTVLPHSTTKIATDLAICPPSETYCQVLSRSGLLTKHGLETKAGTIDRDYNGNVIIILRNTSDTAYHIKKGDLVAQLIVYRIVHPAVQSTNALPDTDQGSNGFGSMGSSCTMTSTLHPSINHITSNPPVERPYNIWMSADPFHKTLEVNIPTQGTHATLGMQLHATPHAGRLQLIDMVKSTPGACLPKWRSSLKRAILLSINETMVRDEKDVIQIVQTLRHSNLPVATCLFATVQYHGLHPTTGSLHLYYDQLNVIGTHLKAAYPPVAPPPPAPNIRQITHAPASDSAASNIEEGDLGKNFTLQELKQCPDWPQWRKARYKMLDSYHEQGMFSEPMTAPTNSNIHQMLW